MKFHKLKIYGLGNNRINDFQRLEINTHVLKSNLWKYKWKKNEFKLSSLKQISQELELYASIKNKYIHVLVSKQQEHINPYMLCVT